MDGRGTAVMSIGMVALLVATLVVPGCATGRRERPAEIATPAVEEEKRERAELQPPPPAPLPQPSPPEVATAPAAPIALAGGITVDRAARRVSIPARIATRVGFLEQVACGRDSREHEALLVLDVKASAVHAALLLLGAEPGRPGRWRIEDGVVVAEAPQGPRLRVLVQVAGEAGEAAREWPVTEWIRGIDGRRLDAAWVFAGSRFADNPRSWKEPGQHYVADYTGSIVGLVTFGDETIAAAAVIPDLVDIEAANWEAWTERMPEEETPVVLIVELEATQSASDVTHSASLAERTPSSR
jgi:hypothetical protein